MTLVRIALCFALATTGLTVAGCNGSGSSPGDGTPPPPPPSESPPSVQVSCPGSGTVTITSGTQIPVLPTFPNVNPQTIETIQCGFDAFSWNSFLALNHSPSGEFGNQDGDNTTVWESWPEASDIFLADGAQPASWPSGDPPPDREIPAACQGVGESGTRVIRQVGKRPDVLEETDEPFQSGPLVDVNGYYSRFEIVVNQEMYNYILDNTLYSKAGQATFATAGNPVSFPCACDADPSGSKCTEGGQEGAMMIKAAWKVLDTDAGDDPTTFHTAQALIYTPPTGDSPESCESRLMGLVGFHIGHKTQPSPQWIWSTFEQVANVPTEGETIPDGARYNYYQPNCSDCGPVNEPPPQPWNPHDEPVSDNKDKSQVERAIALTDATITMNDAVQGILGDTVWQHYQLISTQWPTNASGATASSPDAQNGWCDALNATDLSGAPAPTFLANTTLETYIQGTVPQASSSCIHCHLNATTTTVENNFSDFTYLLERAQ